MLLLAKYVLLSQILKLSLHCWPLYAAIVAQQRCVHFITSSTSQVASWARRTNLNSCLAQGHLHFKVTNFVYIQSDILLSSNITD